MLSDKQTGLEQAVAKKLPNSRHQFCQAHYLRNLATPLSEADTTLKARLRKAVRNQVGELIRRPVQTEALSTGVLTVTGLLPDARASASASAQVQPRVVAPARAADEVISHLFAHTRYLLTLRGRPPLNLAPIETYERLNKVANVSLNLLIHRLDQRLIDLYQGLKTALAPFAATYEDLHQGAV